MKRWVIALLVVAAFGPYLGGGVRTEQAVVYFAALAMFAAGFRSLRFTGHTGVLVGAWSIVLAIAVVGAVAPPFNQTPWDQRSIISGMDNLLLPLAVLVVVNGAVSLGVTPRQVLRIASYTLVVAMSMNTGAAWAQSKGATYERFWDQSDVSSTAANAAINGRFSGLINQPAEAGVLYGLAMLAAIYLWPHRSALLLAVLTLLTVGGALTVSKIFLFVALPLAAFTLIRSPGAKGGRLFAMIAVVAAGWVAIPAGYLAGFPGADQLQRVIPNGQGPWIGVVTAGRFGQEATLSSVIDAVLDGPAWFGFGAGGLEAPYDNGFVEALVMAGVVGVVAMALVWVAMFRGWLSLPRNQERALFGMVLILLFAANLGLPALTANRASTVVWVFLGALLLSGQGSEGEASGCRGEGVGEPGVDGVRGVPGARAGQPHRL